MKQSEAIATNAVTSSPTDPPLHHSSTTLVSLIQSPGRYRYSFGFRCDGHREQSFAEPYVNERLHWFQFFLEKQIEQLSDIYKMHEASIKLFVCADVVERIKPVAMVDVSVTPKHLSINTFNVGLETFSEAA